MNYQSLYDYINDIADNLDQTHKFFHGRKPNLITASELIAPLYIYCLPFISTGTTRNGSIIEETYEINIIFYMQDQADSAIDQNNQEVMQDEIKTLATTSLTADKFLRSFNENNFTDALSRASSKIEITSFTKGNEIKATGWLTGTLLTLRVRVSDQFNYCSITNAV